MIAADAPAIIRCLLDSPPASPTDVMETTAGLLKIEVKKFAVSKSSELESAMVAMAKSRMNAAVVQEDGLLTNNARAIADFAAMRQLFLAGNTKSWDRIQTCTLTTRIRT